MKALTHSGCFAFLLLAGLGCSDDGSNGGSRAAGGAGASDDTTGDRDGSGGSPGADELLGAGGRLEDTLGPDGEPLYDFCSDEEIHQLSFDVSGSVSLADLLASEFDAISGLDSLALVLENGRELAEADLQTIATINKENGAGLTELKSLGLCNLETLSTEAFRDLDEGWLEYLYMDDLLAVEAFAFAGSDNGTTTSLKGISMNSVLTIGEAAFQWGSLESLMLPKVENIEKDAFRDNYRMLEILLPEVKTLADAVFDDNTHLIKATFPELTMVGRNVFDDNHELVEINMPKVTYLGKSFFGSCWALESVHFPSVITVDDNAFDNCQVLTSVSLPAAEDIRNRVFSECVSLREVSLPKVTNFMNDVFLECAGVGGPVPETCCQLERIHLPLVESIGSNTFGSCSELKSVILGDSPPSVAEGAFDGTPASLSVYYTGSAADWSSFSVDGNADADVVDCSTQSAEVCEL